MCLLADSTTWLPCITRLHHFGLKSDGWLTLAHCASLSSAFPESPIVLGLSVADDVPVTKGLS